MKLEDLRPINEESFNPEPANQPEGHSKARITRSPDLPKACIHCKDLLSLSGSKGIATWPVCNKCFKDKYNDNLTTYLKAWINHEHEKGR